MTDWYTWFLLCVLLLWTLSTPRDRNALRIILLSSLASLVTVELLTHQIHGAWKLVVPGAIETLTILSLLQFARNRTGYIQAALLVVAWLAHAGCYLDIALKTDLVYSRYEAVIQLVAIAQILACHETLARCGGLTASWLHSKWNGRGGSFRTARVYHSVLHGKASEIVQALRGTKEGR
jgi:hypothetical protein